MSDDPTRQELIGAFSPDYFAARERFRDLCSLREFNLLAYPISAGDLSQRLTIDVATAGESSERAIVISSGLHGVEGPFGSAVQVALLESGEAQRLLRAGYRLVLLHALNPFGYVHRRRFNEDSVDLNRNFLLPGEEYAGAHPLYRRIDRWLNPPSPPHRLWPVPLAGMVDLLRYGKQDLFAAIPAGQYDFPHGLFFGGSEAAPATRIVQRHMAQWLGDAREIVHLDFHTGLGRWGEHKLLLDCTADDPQATWFKRRFGAARISTLPEQQAATSNKGRQAYVSRGSFGRWCRSRFHDRTYRFATAEFGTYHPFFVLLAMRAENRAHHWAAENAPYDWAKRRLAEVFSPGSTHWRQRVVRDGLNLVRLSAEVDD